tara:strand:+ start:5619 stop:6098 length:480 start_codon:yes stop_codon:yes gene_type:complete
MKSIKSILTKELSIDKHSPLTKEVLVNKKASNDLIQVFDNTHNKKLIERLTNIKGDQIKNFSNDELKNLAKTIINLSNYLGIEKIPESDHIKMLINFLRTYWGSYTLNELRIAIDEAIYRDEVVHYNKLTPQFLNKILKLYDVDRKKALYEYNKVKNDR